MIFCRVYFYSAHLSLLMFCVISVSCCYGLLLLWSKAVGQHIQSGHHDIEALTSLIAKLSLASKLRNSSDALSIYIFI